MAKRDLTLIKEDLITAQQEVVIGGYYYHHRKPEVVYKVLSVSVDVENEERLLVNYQVANSADEVVWARPLKDFLSFVEVNGTHIPKFTETRHP